MRNKGLDSEQNSEVIENATVEAQKSVEQIASESALDAAIPDQADMQTSSSASVDSGAPITDTAHNLAQLLNFGSLMLGAAKFERVAAVWNPTDNKRLADAAIPVLRKSSWGLRFIEFLDGKSGVEELALLMVAAPMAIGTYKAVQEDLNNMAPKVPEKQAETQAQAEEATQ